LKIYYGQFHLITTFPVVAFNTEQDAAVIALAELSPVQADVPFTQVLIHTPGIPNSILLSSFQPSTVFAAFEVLNQSASTQVLISYC
jgi:hypothetical protein